MQQVLPLALPFFGLIFLGFACGKLARYPEAGLQWMTFFIVYIALPSLFFALVSSAPFEELSNWRFALATSLSTGSILLLSFLTGLFFSKGDIRASAIQAVVGGYANIGYMGPGLTLAVLGPKAVIPTALIFLFDTILHFTTVPFLMAIGGKGEQHFFDTAFYVVKRVFTHPFNVATAIAIIAAYFEFHPPQAIETMLVYLKKGLT